MGTSKFEKHIEKKLRGREIKPSAEAWNRISERLDTTVKPKKKNYFWYGIAAGFIGVLLISVFLLNQNNTPIDNGVVNSSKTIEENSQENSKTELEERNQLPVQIAVKDVPSKNIDEMSLEKQVLEKQRVIISQSKEGSISESSIAEKKMNLDKEDPLKAVEGVMNAKIAELLALVDQLEEDNVIVTETEVDSLLRNAQREILSDKLFRQDRTVDAMALLNEVEDELDKSFRDQIFETLKTGFFKVRTAVADRNN